MTRVLALCGTSGSGKTMLSEAYVKGNEQRKYIRTTTTSIRAVYNNPTYEYLMSPVGYDLMKSYQKDIADNLWRELEIGMNTLYDDEYHIAILDRSPTDAYIYEALFTLNSQGELLHNGASVTPYMWAMLRTMEEYKKRSVLLGTQIVFVGLTSMFVTDDPKRPPMWLNERYRQVVSEIFGKAQFLKNQWLRFKPLANTTLDIDGRVNLLNKLNAESFK